MKKICIFLVIGTLLFSLFCGMGASANDNEVLPFRFSNINRVDLSIIFKSGTGYVTAQIDGRADVSNITATIDLYYKGTSGDWIPITTDWQYNENDSSWVASETFTGKRGTEYKVVLTAEVSRKGYGEPITKEYKGTCT